MKHVENKIITQNILKTGKNDKVIKLGQGVSKFVIIESVAIYINLNVYNLFN